MKICNKKKRKRKNKNKNKLKCKTDSIKKRESKMMKYLSVILYTFSVVVIILVFLSLVGIAFFLDDAIAYRYENSLFFSILLLPSSLQIIDF